MKSMTPRTEEELAEILAGAAGPLRICGGATRPIGRPVEGPALSLSGLGGIVEYEPGALTLVARAGTAVEEIEAALAAEGQMLAFEPMDHRRLLGTTGTPTIGGVVAGNVSGPRRVSAVGACRDSLLGVRFVDGRGRIARNGGRVMKNVTGYDLVKLMAGSFGTLGVLTEICCKVLPRPETAATLVFRGLDLAGAVGVMGAALGSPFEVSGAAHVAADGGGTAMTCLRVEGFASSVRYRVGRLQDGLARHGEVEVLDAEATAALWHAIRDVEALARVPGDVWRLSVRPSDAPGLMARLAPGTPVQLDWGGGLIWVVTPAGQDLRAHLAPFQGHATLVRADAATRAALAVFQPEAEAVAALSRGLRSQFDPRGILNPGLMG